MASSSTTPTFSGSSTYAADLQSAIDRAVAFAKLPVTQLQNKQSELSNQQSALTSLSSKFGSLSSALGALNNAASSGSLSTDVTDSAVLNATAAAGAAAGQYTVNITNIGSQTNVVSKSGLTTVTDPAKTDLTSDTTYTMTVDGATFSVTSADGSLNGLAQAINTSGADVSATVINIGGTTSPDYRLSIQSNKYAPINIDLQDSSNTTLLDSPTLGSYVNYTINGSSSISSDVRTLNFATGLTVNALKTGNSTINVSNSTSSLGSALTIFASAYNNVVDELAKARGKANGPLSGESIISSSSAILRNVLSGGTPSGSVDSLTSLGLTFDESGHLVANNSALSSLGFTAISSFLGSTSTSGFLKQASDSLKSITDPTNGMITNTAASYSSQITNITAKIASSNDRIAIMQKSLITKMTKADTMIASLQSQNNYYVSLFAQMRANKQNG
jgi:flagellar hook-associated protein 2